MEGDLSSVRPGFAERPKSPVFCFMGGGVFFFFFFLKKKKEKKKEKRKIKNG